MKHIKWYLNTLFLFSSSTVYISAVRLLYSGYWVLFPWVELYIYIPQCLLDMLQDSLYLS